MSESPVSIPRRLVDAMQIASGVSGSAEKAEAAVDLLLNVQHREDRAAALPLLAADALLTAACEEAMKAANPGSELATVLRVAVERLV